MSNPSSSAQQALEALGSRLREIRANAGLNGLALARLAGWHSSKVSKIEYGKQAPTADDIRAWCAGCSATDQSPDLIASLRAVEGMFVEWRRLERSGFQVFNRSLQPLWERTRQFRIYHSQVVPGPLQTGSYISAVLSGLRDMRDIPDDVAATVQVRLDRQRILYEGDHRFAIVMEESVLRYPIGGPETMVEQLGHLLEAFDLPSVSLGIIPLDADRSAMLPVEGFHIFDDAQVDIELVSGFLKITQPREVAAYAQTFAMLAEQAVYGATARALITSAVTALDDTPPQA